MKRISIMGILLSLAVLTSAQDAKFTVKLSSDTVLFGNYFEVSFTLENGTGTFEPPDFEHFEVVGGPNRSSSFSMINGKTEQSMTYSYYVQPVQEGNYYIESAVIRLDDDVLETPPVEVIVMPNPDNIIQHPHRLPRQTPVDPVKKAKKKTYKF